MNRYRTFGLILILMPGLLLAQKKSKKHDEVPAAFQYAHFIYVDAMDGDVMKPGLLPADRQAIYDVQDSLRDWNRYSLVLRREQADIVLTVRTGRIASAQTRTGISVGSRIPTATPNRPPGQAGEQGGINGQPGDGDNLGASAEVGPANDMLRVYLVDADHKRVGPVWTREMQDGLQAPDLMLMQQLRTAVEHAYPSQPPPAPKQPTP